MDPAAADGVACGIRLSLHERHPAPVLGCRDRHRAGALAARRVARHHCDGRRAGLKRLPAVLSAGGRAMSLRAPLARVLGYGSTQDGVGHWRPQGLAAYALVPLTVWLLLALIRVPLND